MNAGHCKYLSEKKNNMKVLETLHVLFQLHIILA